MERPTGHEGFKQSGLIADYPVPVVEELASMHIGILIIPVG